MSLSNSCIEENFTQRSGFLADSPISIASSPASPVSSCDTLSVQGAGELDANPGLDPDPSVTTLSSSSSHVVRDTALIRSAHNGDRIRALMAKYEQVMSGDAAQTQGVSSDILANQGSQDLGGHSAILPDSDGHGNRIDEKPTKTDAPKRNPTSRGSRREKQGPSRARRRVQKGASVSRRQAYAFERLGGARQATGGIIECQVYWEPTWLPIEHLQGDDAIQEAKDLVVASFGSDTWHKEARKLGLIYEHGRE
ncbi:uncharacterized protein BBA_09063 [Beauveria bassiana ARSEF 2860]|uniref:Uncharacterized protein n=1 Tax=Beauveria bassiana (strain ARSEF 2860) TaxID=655819 RepID=J4VU03_BEAB2|nr:uncharacterized protein BBA_09063 [Beauveria bassiana ARSEF 2860]EJP62015.1 hypothetical protein BBA_09063 [Beauveria bassiana ARSEF 2860]